MYVLFACATKKYMYICYFYGIQHSIVFMFRMFVQYLLLMEIQKQKMNFAIEWIFIEFTQFAMESKIRKICWSYEKKCLQNLCYQINYSYFPLFELFLHDLFYIYRLLSINIPFVPNFQQFLCFNISHFHFLILLIIPKSQF